MRASSCPTLGRCFGGAGKVVVCFACKTSASWISLAVASSDAFLAARLNASTVAASATLLTWQILASDLALPEGLS